MRQASWSFTHKEEILRMNLHSSPQSLELNDGKQLTAKQLIPSFSMMGNLGGMRRNQDLPMVSGSFPEKVDPVLGP